MLDEDGLAAARRLFARVLELPGGLLYPAFRLVIIIAGLIVAAGLFLLIARTRIGVRMKAEQLRILLAVMVLAVCGKLAFDLLVMPAELYSLGAAGGH